MARGIHLKRLKSTDLRAIGVPGDVARETADDENERPFDLLAEVDPVLSQTLAEVRQGLEATLVLLDAALREVRRDSDGLAPTPGGPPPARRTPET